KPGALAEIEFGDGTIPHQKSRTIVESGTRLTMRYAGGGGYGPPEKRARADIEADLKDGYITSEGAARDYGHR
ncbi:MAG: hypothetical protein WD270_08045, partial [Acetobacterales bacterium]